MPGRRRHQGTGRCTVWRGADVLASVRKRRGCCAGISKGKVPARAMTCPYLSLNQCDCGLSGTTHRSSGTAAPSTACSSTPRGSKGTWRCGGQGGGGRGQAPHAARLQEAQRGPGGATMCRGGGGRGGDLEVRPCAGGGFSAWWACWAYLCRGLEVREYKKSGAGDPPRDEAAFISSHTQSPPLPPSHPQLFLHHENRFSILPCPLPPSAVPAP